MKVGIVVPELAQREKLIRLVCDKLGWQLLWEAGDDSSVVHRCLHQKPDLVLVMPAQSGTGNGESVVRSIMKGFPCAVVMITNAGRTNPDDVFNVLSAGALDVVEMPSDGADSLVPFISKMRLVGKLVEDYKAGESGVDRSVVPVRKQPAGDADLLVAIGCSTGGPGAVASLLSGLTADLPAAIVIVQHVAEEYASGMAEWLDSQVPMPVRIVREGEKPEVGTVLLAKTNDHLVMDPAGKLVYVREPVENPYRPSVDEFFCSIGQYWRNRIIAVLLTGMGRDGGRGLLALRRLGHYTFAQNEASCAVYGMPQDAIRRGAADDIMTPQAIGQRLQDMIVSSPDGETMQGRGRHL